MLCLYPYRFLCGHRICFVLAIAGAIWIIIITIHITIIVAII